MADEPLRPPAGQIVDPALYGLARAEWPGQPVTTTMLHDIAFMRGRSPFVVADPQAITDMAIEMRKEERRAAAASRTRQSYRLLDFDPNHDYRKET